MLFRAAVLTCWCSSSREGDAYACCCVTQLALRAFQQLIALLQTCKGCWSVCLILLPGLHGRGSRTRERCRRQTVGPSVSLLRGRHSRRSSRCGMASAA